MSFISRVLSSGPAIEIRLNSGKTLRGSIHPSFNAQPALLGRAVDLSKAYKQAALHPASKKHSFSAGGTEEDGRLGLLCLSVDSFWSKRQ